MQMKDVHQQMEAKQKLFAREEINQQHRANLEHEEYIKQMKAQQSEAYR